MSKASESLSLFVLRQTIEHALTTCSKHLPDGWKVAFVAYPPDGSEGDGSSTVFLSDGSMDGARQALESLAADPNSEAL